LLECPQTLEEVGLARGIGTKKCQARDEPLFIASIDKGNNLLYLVAIGSLSLAICKIQLDLQYGPEVLNEEGS